MGHSFARIWLHLIFSTKEREPLIDYQSEKRIYNYIYDQLENMECAVQIINGMPDHIHILYSQHPKIAVAAVVKQLKGASSFWINKEKLTQNTFAWQTGYGVFSVGKDQIKRTSAYILNQKEHHSQIDFVQELKEFENIT